MLPLVVDEIDQRPAGVGIRRSILWSDAVLTFLIHYPVVCIGIGHQWQRERISPSLVTDLCPVGVEIFLVVVDQIGVAVQPWRDIGLERRKGRC